MKTFLLTAFAILLLTITCRAQTNIFPASGYVGIGTTTPTGKLQVLNTYYDLLTATYTLDIGAKSDLGGWARALRVVNTSGSPDGTDGGAFGVKGTGAAANYVYMAIPTASTSPIGYNSANILALDNLGNVGIGTTTPGLKAHIIGPVGFPATSGTAQTGILRLQGTGNSAVLDFGVNGGSGAALQVTSNGNLALTYPLLLNPNGGSVGIGASPNFASGTGLEIQQAGPVTLRMENSTNSKSMELRQTSTYFSLFNINGQHTIFAENGGNVGIGTTAPVNKLHIVDVTGTNSLNLQLSTNTLSETIGVAFGTQPGNRTKAAITGVNTNTGNAGGALAFYTNAGASLNEAMRITSSGNVGIGTTSPNAELDIQLATATTPLTTADEGLRLSTSTTSTSNTTHISSPFIKLFGGIWNGTVNSSRGFTQQVTGISGTNYGYRLAVGSTDVPNALSITGLTGNVGIGSATPGSSLEVYGSAQSSSALTDAGSRAGNIAINTTGTSAGSGGALTFGNAQSNTAGSIGWAAIKGVLTNGAGSTVGDLAFSTRNVTTDNALTERMRISGAGNVGIGTQSPDQKLTVNGTVHSSQVIVDTNIPTPDYVFDKTYDLPSLTTVKTYIDKNHHLPEMPSAVEFAKNGQNLGDMNTLLLKKVEELTLYLIANEKKMKEQDERIQKLEKELKNK